MSQQGTRHGRPRDVYVPVVMDWLQLVGAQYDIEPEEVHHRFRVADSMKPVRNHFAFWFESSAQEIPARAGDNSSADGNDADIVLYNTYMRTLVVECCAEEGMSILEGLCASVEHPTVSEVFVSGECNLVIVDVLDISDETEDTDSRTDWKYTSRFRVRVNTQFELTRANHIVDQITLTGKLINDLDEELDISVTAPPA